MAETILITGGAGFIGSHLADDAVARGHRVVVLDDLSTGHRHQVPAGAELVAANLVEADLDHLLRHFGVTVVSHHAAQVNVRISADDPELDARINVLGTLRLAVACQRAGVRKILFASSGGTVYGEQRVFPCDETHPTGPTSPYGCAKLAAEAYLLAFGHSGQLDPVILRYANVYGPRQDPKGEAGIVAILAERLLASEVPRIFGTGEQTRDYVFVGDLVAANRAVIDAWQPGVYNVGTGRETSVNEVLAAVSDALGVDPTPRFEPANPFELQRSVLSPARLEATFGAAPTTDLATGLRATLPFYRAKLENAATAP